MSSETLEQKKRFRAVNFTAEEVPLLIRLALKEKHILENKETDSRGKPGKKLQKFLMHLQVFFYVIFIYYSPSQFLYFYIIPIKKQLFHYNNLFYVQVKM